MHTANGDGLRIPLRQLPDIELTNGRPSIQHHGARRRQTVTCNVEKRDVSSFTDEARKRIEKNDHSDRDVPDHALRKMRGA